MLYIFSYFCSQDNKSDVKAIMARFQSGGTSIEPGAGGRPKAAVHPTLSGPAVPSKKPFLESSLSGSAAAAATANSTTPKPCYLKNTSSTKSAPESRESPRPKAFVSRFENSTTNSNEDSKPPFIKNVKPKPPDSSQDSELKPLFPKPVLQKPSANSATLESKNTFPKPPPVTNKPPWAPKTENNGSSPAATPPKMPPAPKPTSSIARMRQQPESESKDGEPVIKPFTGSGVKPSSFRAAHSVFKKVEEAAKEDSKPLSSKESSASTPATPPKPNYGRKPSASSMQSANDDPSAPKRKPLPNILAIGSAPSKPNRPPRVNLDKFKKSAESPSEGENIYLIYCISVWVLSLNRSKVEAKEQDKKREKEEKKRAEQEKKDQKERERKDQEARKKFKVSSECIISLLINKYKSFFHQGFLYQKENMLFCILYLYYFAVFFSTDCIRYELLLSAALCFQFEGEIQVMYQVTAACNKKASGRDLAVQVGEILDVISNSESDKLICRNKEGKCEYRDYPLL
uniref:Helically-extended SH3 domain-containing protein n=1 Tax=Astyanax mexicanus TaxID=7994 RepID=A0A8B9GNE6_ASTMX